MADVKFPNISQNANSSFVEGRGSNQQNNSMGPHGLQNHYEDGSHRNGHEEARGNSFQSNRGFSVDNRRNQMEAKKQRKDIERDAQLLANRIALLKQEEMRTWKKIEETKKRAKEVTELKRKNEERLTFKMEQERMNQMMRQENQQKINQLRRQRELEKQKIQEAIHLSKKEEAKQTKMVQMQNKQRKNQIFGQINQDNTNKSNMVKQQERIAILRKQEFNRRKQIEARQELDRKIEEEERIIKQKEQEVMQMEMLEMELIKKLQNTQAIQKQAYSELEEALKTKGLGQNTSYTTGGLVAYGKVSGLNQSANGQLQFSNTGGDGYAQE